MNAHDDHSSFAAEQSCIDEACSGDREVGKKCHRHTPNQIQELENFFKEFPNPNKVQRAALSTRLGLEIRQVKFWFQNKRTQLKTQSERYENGLLKQQHERLCAENELLKHAYANALCQSCGGTTLSASLSFEHEQLRTENARLKSELQLLCSISDMLLSESASSS